VVGVAEVVVYAAYLRQKAEAREKEGKKKERKVLIGEVKFDKDKDWKKGEIVKKLKEDGAESREEIWGRGLNGGMRRRVRDQWEKEQESMSS